MIPESINDLSVIATNNVPQGGDNVGGTLDDILRAIQAIMKRDLALKKAETAAGTSFAPTDNVLSENVQAALAELGNKVNAINWSSISGKPSLVETSRSISAGTGLAGGGNLSANRTLSIDSAYSPNTSKSLTTENLNGITTPGFYHQTTNANALTSRNYPDAKAGTLVVTHAAGVVQEYTCYQSGNKYYRGFYSSSWSAWKRVVVDTDSIAWSRLTGVPEHATRANTWAEVTSKPATATRWPTWTEVASKPTTATRWPSWGEVTSKPSTFTPPSGHGGVGTYAFVGRSNFATTTWGTTVAGSHLRLASTTTNGVGLSSTALSGTWRVMGNSVGATTSFDAATLALRIS